MNTNNQKNFNKIEQVVFAIAFIVVFISFFLRSIFPMFFLLVAIVYILKFVRTKRSENILLSIIFLIGAFGSFLNH